MTTPKSDLVTESALTEDEQSELVQWLYEAYRIGKFGVPEHLPMWHEPESRYRVPGPEARGLLNAVESILRTRTAALTAEVERLTQERDEWERRFTALRERVTSVHGHSFLSFDGMTWPNPVDPNEVEWTLRYGEPTKAHLVVAASFMHAYRALISLPQRERNSRVKAIREALSAPDRTRESS